MDIFVSLRTWSEPPDQFQLIECKITTYCSDSIRGNSIVIFTSLVEKPHNSFLFL